MPPDDGRWQVVRLLLDAGVNPDCIREDNFQTPLFMACATERTDIVRLLCDRGVDTSKQDKSGNTPLLIAIRSKAVAVVNTLVMGGCSVTGLCSWVSHWH